MMVKGRVASGIGSGKVLVEVHSETFRTNLGFKPYPGTLNIELYENLRFEGVSPIEILGVGKEGCAGALCYPCEIRGVDVVIIRPSLKATHPLGSS